MIGICQSNIIFVYHKKMGKTQNFPIWIDDEEILVSGLGAKPIKKNIQFTGFGGTIQENLY